MCLVSASTDQKDDLREYHSLNTLILEILLPCGNKRVAPTIHEGQKLDGNMIQEDFKQASVYLRPSEPLQVKTSDSEENCVEEEVETGVQMMISASAKTSTAELPATEAHAMAISISTQHVEQPSTNAQASSSSQQETSQSNSSTSTYINLINDSLDEDEEEELYTAIIASVEDQTRPKEDSSVSEILKELGEKIKSTGICKFSINGAAVLDGAIPGFQERHTTQTTQCALSSLMTRAQPKRLLISVARRESLRLLMEALSHSEMLEGHEGHLNLALDSFGIYNCIDCADDRYCFAGRSIAVSLVHGGPAPCFLSETLFSCLVKGPEMSRPVTEDIADNELYEKLKWICESRTVEELQMSTEPLTDYLSHAGCLRPLTSLMDKNPLLEDLLMFLVVHRVRGPFERRSSNIQKLFMLSSATLQGTDQQTSWMGCLRSDGRRQEAIDERMKSEWSSIGEITSRMLKAFLVLKALEDWVILYMISDYLDNLKIKTRSVCLHQRSFLNPSSLP
ncbi:unnamed protein product [Leuciscus chuanchicus]